MLVPEVARGAAYELNDLRAHCDAVVRRLVADADDAVTVLAPGAERKRYGADAGGSLRGFGVDLEAGGPDVVLGSELTIGAWLLDRAGWSGDRVYATVHADTRWNPNTPVLLLGDGSAKRSESAPGHFDERAAAYDKSIAHALAIGDASALASLDVRLGEQLWAGGVPSLVSLGASLVSAHRGVSNARLRYDEAPYGVGYFVAEWSLEGDTL